MVDLPLKPTTCPIARFPELKLKENQMIKVIGTAFRRDDFSKEEFFDYWLNVHAPISRQAPGIMGYVVSEVVRKIAGEIEVDAFVEQWFESDQALAAATASEAGQAAWSDVGNYAKTTGTFWVAKQHVIIPPPPICSY